MEYFNKIMRNNSFRSFMFKNKDSGRPLLFNAGFLMICFSEFRFPSSEGEDDPITSASRTN